MIAKVLCAESPDLSISGTGTRFEPVARGCLLKSMCDVIRHRGPDDDGFFLKDGVSLGMRRLSIIDLAGGAQPISGEDGSVSDRFQRRDLQLPGAQTRARKARPHLQNPFRHRNNRSRLRGVWAGLRETPARHVCLRDLGRQETRSVYIARDRVGKKPLYYTVTPGGTLVFGSEIKSHARASRRPRARSIWTRSTRISRSATFPIR